MLICKAPKIETFTAGLSTVRSFIVERQYINITSDVHGLKKGIFRKIRHATTTGFTLYYNLHIVSAAICMSD